MIRYMVGLTWILLFHCRPSSAWANGNVAEVAGQLSKMVEQSDQSHPNPSIQLRITINITVYFTRTLIQTKFTCVALVMCDRNRLTTFAEQRFPALKDRTFEQLCVDEDVRWVSRDCNLNRKISKRGLRFS